SPAPRPSAASLCGGEGQARSPSPRPQRDRAFPVGRLDPTHRAGGRGSLMTTLQITITPTGETHIETQGFRGSDCRQASKFLERALRPRPRERLTSEFYASEALSQSERLETGN